MKKLLLSVLVVSLGSLQAQAFGPDLEISLEPVGTYATGAFDEDAAQIVDFHAASKRLFITNANDTTIDVVNISQVDDPQLLMQISLPGTPLSVAVHPYWPLIAVSCEADPATDPGTVEFYLINGYHLGSVQVGALPDMITWTPNGRKLLVANEGEPTNTEYEAEFEIVGEGNDRQAVFENFVDPEGSVSIITLSNHFLFTGQMQQSMVFTVDFNNYDDQKQELLDKGVRIIGPETIVERDVQIIPPDPCDPCSVEKIIVGDPTVIDPPPTVSQDLEPEYIAVSGNNKTAWVTLQENNAIAEIDIPNGKVIDIYGLGYKDHSMAGYGLDASDKDKAINITTHPVLGMFQPDAIATFRALNRQYLITANEGDARDFEETRMGKLDLADSFGIPDPCDPCSLIFPILDKENLGRLKTTKAFPAQTNDQGKHTALYCYGGRSFTIWDTQGNFISDSGDLFEQIMADPCLGTPEFFNSTDDESKFDSRSDDKGPEPEHVVVAGILWKQIAFITLERMSGIMIFDVSDPAQPKFLDYVNNRDFDADPETPEAGDLSTEGLVFIPAHKSPNRRPLVVSANAVSGTTTVFQVSVGLPFYGRIW